MDRVELRFLEGLRFGIETADLSFNRLCQILLSVAQADHSRDKPPNWIFPAAITEAWATVDSMHRLKELLERTPSLKLKEPAVGLYLRAAELLNELRNSFHHASGDFYKVPFQETAIWGAINWCVPRGDHVTVFGLVPGTIIEGSYPVINPLGRTIHAPLDLVTLRAFEKTADLSDLYRKMAGLAAHLEAVIAERIAGRDGSICDIITGMDIYPKDPDADSKDPSAQG